MINYRRILGGVRVSFGLERDNVKRVYAAFLTVVVLLLGVCLASISPLKLAPDAFQRNGVSSFLHAMKIIDGTTVGGDVLRSKFRSLVFPASQVFVNASVESELYGIPDAGSYRLANVLSMPRETAVNGSDMVSRE
jgi:hypothetical protein